MNWIGLTDLLWAMGVSLRDYRAAEMAVHGAVLVPVRAPAGLDVVFHVADGAVAWTAYRVGGHTSGAVVVESLLPGGPPARMWWNWQPWTNCTNGALPSEIFRWGVSGTRPQR